MMVRKFVPVAIAYDFDGTLAPGNMQEHSFIPGIRTTTKTFWKKANFLAKQNEADDVLTYMNLMVAEARAKGVPIRRQDFLEHGKSVTLFKGVKTWFDRIDNYGRGIGLKIQHYVISSGIHEMIDGTPIAKRFERIYASSFKYDANGVAEWPALAINFTTKTQYLFRINKGALDVYDNKKINRFVSMKDRPIPFQNMIFIGDGETDIPCFSLVKSLGGHSIAVYKPNTRGAKGNAKRLFDDGRVNFVTPADYSSGRHLERVVQAILDKTASDCRLRFLGRQG